LFPPPSPERPGDRLRNRDLILLTPSEGKIILSF
jgi:hypothetical protein